VWCGVVWCDVWCGVGCVCIGVRLLRTFHVQSHLRGPWMSALGPGTPQADHMEGEGYGGGTGVSPQVRGWWCECVCMHRLVSGTQVCVVDSVSVCQCRIQMCVPMANTSVPAQVEYFSKALYSVPPEACGQQAYSLLYVKERALDYLARAEPSLAGLQLHSAEVPHPSAVTESSVPFSSSYHSSSAHDPARLSTTSSMGGRWHADHGPSSSMAYASDPDADYDLVVGRGSNWPPSAAPHNPVGAPSQLGNDGGAGGGVGHRTVSQAAVRHARVATMPLHDVEQGAATSPQHTPLSNDPGAPSGFATRSHGNSNTNSSNNHDGGGSLGGGGPPS